MKRANNLFPKLVSEENLRLAIFAVNVTHRFHPHHRPNRTVARVEADIDRYVKELREINYRRLRGERAEACATLGQERRKVAGHIGAETVT